MNDITISTMFINTHTSILQYFNNYIFYESQQESFFHDDKYRKTLLDIHQRFDDCLQNIDRLRDPSQSVSSASETRQTGLPLNQQTSQYILKELIDTRNKLMQLRNHKQVKIINENIQQFLQHISHQCTKSIKKLPNRIILVDSGANITVFKEPTHTNSTIVNSTNGKNITVAKL